MAPGDHPARVVHAIPGRLRLRLEGDTWTPASIETLGDQLDMLRALGGVGEVRLNPRARRLTVRYDQTLLTEVAVLDAVTTAGVRVADEEPLGAGDAAVGLPIRLDRRTLRALAISGVSLYGARHVGAAIGGAAIWPAYFVIWFGLRRLENRFAPRDPGPPS